MAVVQIPNLPAAIGLTGQDQMEAVQGGVSVRISVSQIASFTVSYINSILPPAAIWCTNRQFRTALANIASPPPNALVDVDNNVPADISNAVNIQWNHGNWVLYGDDVCLFTQSILGYSNAQMLALIQGAQIYPL